MRIAFILFFMLATILLQKKLTDYFILTALVFTGICFFPVRIINFTDTSFTIKKYYLLGFLIVTKRINNNDLIALKNDSITLGDDDNWIEAEVQTNIIKYCDYGIIKTIQEKLNSYEYLEVFKRVQANATA